MTVVNQDSPAGPTVSRPGDGMATLLRDLEAFGIIGSHPKLLDAAILARRLAAARVPVLIIGETGTGKELFAQAIHRWSGRTGPFVDVNCGALPGDLVEGELFGHRKGAFTGAVDDRQGLIATAHRGTLFLDELTALSGAAQAKFLRVLETQEVRRLGETEKRKIDFRVVAAAQLDVRAAVDQGRFRRDLYHRTAGGIIVLPALRDRGDDRIHLARLFAGQLGRNLADSADRALCEYRWPGNVRELVSVVERASLRCEGTVDSAAIETAIHEGAAAGDCGECQGEKARHLLFVRECMEAGWGVNRIAAAAGVHRATVFRWIRGLRLSLRGGHGP